MPHLVLDRSYAEQPDFAGAKYVMSPPLREKPHQQALWQAVADGDAATVATDHAPFDFAGQKEMGRGDFTKIPNGIPGIEDRVHLLYTHGVATGRIDLHRFVEVASTAAARLFGLFPKKGTIQPGADADLVVFDPTYRGVLSAGTQQMNVDYCAYEGWPIIGRTETVAVRGACRSGTPNSWALPITGGCCAARRRTPPKVARGIEFRVPCFCLLLGATGGSSKGDSALVDKPAVARAAPGMTVLRGRSASRATGRRSGARSRRRATGGRPRWVGRRPVPPRRGPIGGPHAGAGPGRGGS